MIEADTIRQAYGKSEISPFGYVRSKINPADALTKVKHSAPLNECTLQTKFKFSIEQYVVHGYGRYTIRWE